MRGEELVPELDLFRARIGLAIEEFLEHAEHPSGCNFISPKFQQLFEPIREQRSKIITATSDERSQQFLAFQRASGLESAED
ncbi:MAG: hypothetical protein U0Q16_25275 [Bryobacteraceae bacterium]